MFSPKGFITIKELEWKVLSMDHTEHITSADFHESLEELPNVYAASPEGPVTRLSPVALLVGPDGEYVFVNRKNWCLEFDRIRAECQSGDVGLSSGLFVVGRDYDDQSDPLQRLLTLDTADKLLPFEGQPLCAEADDGEALLRTVGARDFSAPVKVLSGAEAEEQGYKDFIAPYLAGGSKATMTDHFRWGEMHNLRPRRVRELKKKFAPAEWAKPGRTNKVQISEFPESNDTLEGSND